jgi:chaperonin cofactor prefoldin
MENIGIYITIGAIVISMTTLILTGLNMRKSATKEYVDQLENQIKDLREELKDLQFKYEKSEEHRTKLQDENVDLLKKLFLANGK